MPAVSALQEEWLRNKVEGLRAELARWRKGETVPESQRVDLSGLGSIVNPEAASPAVCRNTAAVPLALESHVGWLVANEMKEWLSEDGKEYVTWNLANVVIMLKDEDGVVNGDLATQLAPRYRDLVVAAQLGKALLDQKENRAEKHDGDIAGGDHSRHLEVCRAHKFVPTTHSKVFASMLTAEMQEKGRDCIELQTVSFQGQDAFDMVSFLNTAEVPQEYRFFVYPDHRCYLGLLEASHLYYVEPLCELAINQLKAFVDATTFCTILLAGDRYSSSELVDDCFEYLDANPDQRKPVFESAEWADLVRTHSQLCADMKRRVGEGTGTKKDAPGVASG